MTMDTEMLGTAPPALFQHLVNTYDMMSRHATKTKLEVGDPPAEGEYLVYEGHMTKLVTSQLGLPIPYYTAITKALKQLGCAAQLKRGGGSAPSRWVLLRPPSLELFNSAERMSGVNKRVSKTAQLEQRVGDLQSRVEGLEDAFEELLAAIKIDSSDN